MSIERTIVCDGCANVLASARRLTDARRDVIEMGGVVAPARGMGRDLCPECASQPTDPYDGDEQ